MTMHAMGNTWTVEELGRLSIATGVVGHDIWYVIVHLDGAMRYSLCRRRSRGDQWHRDQYDGYSCELPSWALRHRFSSMVVTR